jgi:hypothetical protein
MVNLMCIFKLERGTLMEIVQTCNVLFAYVCVSTQSWRNGQCCLMVVRHILSAAFFRYFVCWYPCSGVEVIPDVQFKLIINL